MSQVEGHGSRVAGQKLQDIGHRSPVMGHRSNFFRFLRFFHDPEKFTPLAKLYIQTSLAYMPSIQTNITKARSWIVIN